MSRVLPLLLLLTLLGCRQDEALQVRIQIDPDVQADCIALDVLSPAGEPLQTKTVPRVADRDEVRLAVFRGGLPTDVQLQARALWGPSCIYNGHSDALSAHFDPKTIGSELLHLSRPAPQEDADGDGFVADTLGGPDCADSEVRSHPQVQETCDATTDLNCDGLRGCDDATCSGQDGCARVATTLRLQAPPEGGRAGECVPLTVTRLDAEGRPATPGYPTGLTVHLPEGTGLALYQDDACHQGLGSLSIAPGASSTRFFAQGLRPVDVTVSVDSTDLATVSLAYSLRPGRATQLRFISGALDVQAGACEPLVLERRDSLGNLSSGEAQQLALSPSPTAQTALHADPGCSAGLSEFTFPADASTLTLYFHGERAGPVPVTVSSSGATSATRTQNVKAGPAERLNVLLSTAELLAGECSPLSHLESVDHYGNRSLGPDLVATLTATPSTMNASFFADSACGIPITTTSFHADATADFYFKAKTGGLVSIGASMTGRTVSPQTQSIIGAVRSGSCALAAGTLTVDCAITPKLRNRNKSFLVFQATTVDASPRASYVRCALKDTQTITCGHFDGTGAQEAHIQWQVVELVQGLSVQHLEQPCVSPAKGVSFDINPVDPTHSFLLFSSIQHGDNVSANDLMTVSLNGNNKVQAQMDNVGICDQQTLSLQVVTLDKLNVTRGVTGMGSTSPLEAASTYGTDEGGRSVLLSTFQSSYDNGDKLCNRMVRGEQAPAANKVRFSWGLGVSACNAPGITSVSWERLVWPVGTRVQALPVNLLAGQTQSTADLDAVDMTRTLLLTSTQVSGGQGNGETDYAASDIVGVATARLSLDSPTRLRVARDTAEGNSRWTVFAIQLEP